MISHAATFNQYWYNEDNTLYSQTTCSTGGDINLPTAPTKYGYDFVGWGKLLYIPIEYLESTGTQWIDTDFAPNNNSGLDIDFYVVRSNNPKVANAQQLLNNTVYMFGIGSSGQLSTNILVYNGEGNKEGKFWRVTNLYGGGTGRYRIIIDKQQQMRIIASDESVLTYSPQKDLYQITTDTLTLFNNTIVRIFLCKIYDNDTLIRDMIPVLDPSGTPCMYDKVEGKFYYNQGTGQFIAGPEIGAE